MREQLVTTLLPLLANKTRREFNVFDVMRYGGYEKQLSDVFAWLLDADQTHKLGDRFVRIFIDQVNAGMPHDGDLGEKIPHGRYSVRQEVNTAQEGDGEDIADLILEDDKTVLVIENFYTSSGHGHSYDGYRSFGEREGQRSVVVLLCETQNTAEQSDGWENASVVTYASLVEALMKAIEGDAGYRRDCSAQYTFLEQLHDRFVKGPRQMDDDSLIDFVEAMCRTGEAGRYRLQPVEPASIQFADDLRDQAKVQFEESRALLHRVKAALRSYSTGILKTQINEELAEARINEVRANWSGGYQWTINFFTVSGASEPIFQIKFGPSAWLANERTRDDMDNEWEETVPLDRIDYSRLFITRRHRPGIRQSDVKMSEALDGLSRDDFRLRDEIVEFVFGGV